METSEIIKKVRKIEIKTRGLSSNIFAGQYHSAFKGRGMAFSEVREYQFGDDVRDIDWNVLSSQGIEFAYIKATEGSSNVDRCFDANWNAASKTELKIGAYHFFSFESSGENQAKLFCSTVEAVPGMLPPVIDVEFYGHFHSADDIDVDAVKKELRSMVDILTDHYGVKPIIYTYYKFKTRYLNGSVFDDYPYWIAHYYVDKVEYEGAWKFWQHTDAGCLPGIKGRVDFNIYNGSYYDLRKLTIGSRELIGEDAYAD